ncbi:protein nervous wreck-like isoform X2 [Artemia franciscana]|uniref:F-BAR and double SH3 domains protein 2 n=1 Tax=Artemia franciscana TaxID=6661 RepID=A0AA88H8U3_ARTSF|nr:hypothetical protein QYM36_016672 [Artemia franciscana]
MSSHGSIKKPSTYSKILKTVHTDQIAKLQVKNQQECELLEDIRNFMKQRSSIEKSCAESLIKVCGTYLSKKVPPVSETAKEHLTSDQSTVWQIWRSLLDETEKIAKARLAACEVFQQQISEDAKNLRLSKTQNCKKHVEYLKVVQLEVQEQVHQLERAKKSYLEEEQEAHGIRDKVKEAEEKLKKKKGGLFSSVSSLQKSSQKLGSRKNLCDEKSASARNEYILALAASNAHQDRYFNTDLKEALQMLEANVYEKVRDYFSLLARTELITWSAANSSYTKIRDQTSSMSKEHSISCYMACYPVLKQHITYEFEPVEDDPVRGILKDSGTMDVWKEAEKWVTCFIKEKRKLSKLQQKIETSTALKEAGNKVDPSDASGIDLDTKIEEARNEIRKCQISKLKAEARLECLREGGVNVEEFFEKYDTKESLDMPRTNSQLSLSQGSPAKFSDNTESEHSDPFESDLDSRSRAGSTVADNPAFEYKDSDEEEVQAPVPISVPAVPPQNWTDPMAIDWGDDESNTADITVVEKEAVEEIVPLPQEVLSSFPVRCTALYNYESQNPDELSITENEELEAISEGDGDGWIRARNYRGEEGFVPQNYVAIETETLQASDLLQQQVSFSSVDYTYSDGCDGPCHEPVNEHENPTLNATTSQEPMPVNEHFPSPVNDCTAATHCRALYDYEATSPDEISLFEGQIIEIVRRQVHGVDDGWWEGRLEDGTMGIFPSLMIEECNEKGEPLNTVVDDEELEFEGVPPSYTPPEIPTFLLPPDKVIVTQPTPETEHYMGNNFTDQYHNNFLEEQASDEDSIQDSKALANEDKTVIGASILITAATPSLEGPTDDAWEAEVPDNAVKEQQDDSNNIQLEKEEEERNNTINEDENSCKEVTNDKIEEKMEENAQQIESEASVLNDQSERSKEENIKHEETHAKSEGVVDSTTEISPLTRAVSDKGSANIATKTTTTTHEYEESRSLSFELDPEKLQQLETLNESYA